VLDAPASRDDAVVQAIYGVLSACTDSGLLRRIEPAGHPGGSSGGSGTTITTWCAGGAAAPTWNRSTSVDP